MTDRLNQTMATDPEFAQALARGEPWALDCAECSRGLDGKASRRYPERSVMERQKSGPRNWCGSCPHKEGCFSCDLGLATGATYQALKRLNCE